MELLERPENVEEDSDQFENLFSYSPPSPLPTPKQPQTRIVIFREHIYTLNQHYGGLYFASDYYTDKVSINKKSSSHTKFSVDDDDKTLHMYALRENESQKKEDYAEFQKNAVELTGKTPAEIDAEHTELLRKRVIRKIVDIPTREEIQEREQLHRAELTAEIQGFMEEISPKLYNGAEEGHNCVSWDFNHFNQRFVTKYGKLSQLTKAPCLDGKERNFSEYIYYLAEKVFVRHADETDDVLWFGQRLCEEVRKVFPHLAVTAGNVEKGAILPSIKVHFVVDHTMVYR